MSPVWGIFCDDHRELARVHLRVKHFTGNSISKSIIGRRGVFRAIAKQKVVNNASLNSVRPENPPKEHKGCTGEELQGDPQEIVDYVGSGQHVVRTKHLIFVSVALPWARVHDTAGVRSSDEIIRILCHEHFR